LKPGPVFLTGNSSFSTFVSGILNLFVYLLKIEKMAHYILFISGGEIVLVMLVALLFFGSKAIPDIAKTLGKGVREFKKATEEIKRELEENTSDIKRDIREMKETVEQETKKIGENIEKVSMEVEEKTTNLTNEVDQEFKD